MAEKSAPITYARLAPIIEALTAGTMQHIRRLEARIAALESRPGLKYHGAYRGGEFVEGDAVTHEGSLWIARRTTTSRPGSDDSWTLAAKRGRDAK